MTIKNGLLYYVLLAGLSIVTPYIWTIACIIITGDREDGMKLGAIPGLITVHLIFGLIFIKYKFFQKFLLTLLLTTLSFGLVWLGMSKKIIHTGWDLYGFYDLSITNLLAGILVWESFYQINNRLKLEKQ